MVVPPDQHNWYVQVDIFLTPLDLASTTRMYVRTSSVEKGQVGDV